MTSLFPLRRTGGLRLRSLFEKERGQGVTPQHLNMTGMIMPSLMLLSSASAIEGCGMQNEIKDSQVKVFEVGPEESWTDGRNERFRIYLPAEYVDQADLKTSKSPTRVSSVTVPVGFPEGKPVPKTQIGLHDVIILTASWDPGNPVKARLDGRWNNYYTRYSKKIPRLYGLDRFTTSEIYDESVLYADVSDNLMIECKKIAHQDAAACQLMKGGSSHVVLRATFDGRHISQWRNIVAISQRVFSDIRTNNGGVK